MPWMTKKMNIGMTVLGAVFTVVGGITPLFTEHGPVLIVSVALLIVGVLAVVVFLVIPEIARRRRIREKIPSFTDLKHVGDRYVVVQADASDIGKIAKQEASIYTSEDRIPEAVLKEWYDANPSGFTVVKTADGSLVVHLNILPLRPNTCQQFIAGSIVEREIRGDSLFGSKERASITRLHIESVMLDVPKPRSKEVALRALASALPDVFARVADHDKIERIYAIAASDEGKDLLQDLGFAIEGEARRRKDGHNLYSCTWQTIADHARAIRRDQTA